LSHEPSSPKVFTVSELTGQIMSLLEARFDFIWIEGEISNFSAPVSGHYYMALKDDRSQIRAVMFRLQARYLRFMPENGMRVIAQGKVSVYAPRGEYQLILDYLEPMGVGALALAFEQLKRKLAAQGLFDPAIKRPLPYLPQRVAVVTSPTGAAIRDFLKIVHRRFANLEVVVVPVRVQGEGASKDIVKGIDLANEFSGADVLVLTRGGGSLEDLWAFNEEEVALAIRRSKIPVVSAVGHEIDITISDLAADLRAPTPSAAAELLVVEKEVLERRVKEAKERSVAALSRIREQAKQDLSDLRHRLKDPRRRLADFWMRLDEAHTRTVRAVGVIVRNNRLRLESERRALTTNSPVRRILRERERMVFRWQGLAAAEKRVCQEQRSRLRLVEAQMANLSPLGVLKRGYSITRKVPEGTLLTDAALVGVGDQVEVLLAKGALGCRVEQRSGRAAGKREGTESGLN
jgi:exodeoxyribonuclease VII large subunit